MTVSLADLSARLAADVPPRNSVPSSDQYDQAVKDAVADFGRRAPLEKITTLAIVSGTAAYSLPNGFLSIIKLESTNNPDGVIVNSSGFLVPISNTYNERHTISGLTITFYPTPAYSMSRDLWYASGYYFDGTDFLDLTSEGASVAILKAQALALRLQANVASKEGWKYQIGDEMVDKSGLGKNLHGQAANAESAYMDALTAYNGRLAGVRGQYTAYEGRGFV